MTLADRLLKDAEKKIEKRMGPVVGAMASLEKKIEKLIVAIEANTKAMNKRK